MNGLIVVAALAVVFSVVVGLGLCAAAGRADDAMGDR